MDIGCSGFGMSQALYYQTFDCVEVQQTFYEPPRLSTLARWRTKAPPEFKFVIKAWQLITHESTSPTYRRLKTKLSESQHKQCGSFRLSDPVKAAWETTIACANELHCERILIQSPASFTPTKINKENMHKFFAWAHKPESVSLFWEPRGEWSSEEVKQICADTGLMHAVDPFFDDSVTPQNLYFRLHGGAGYHHDYNNLELTTLLNKLMTNNKTACVFFNNRPMTENATRFKSMVSLKES